MASSDLLYRLKQKWIYHSTAHPFEKRVAELNRNERIIDLHPTTFSVKGCVLQFSKEHHSFLVDRFDLFMSLLNSRGKFELEGNDLFYIIDNVFLKITTEEEIFIVQEIFLEKCYGIITPWKYNVIDIGMNVGFASLFFANQENVLKVFSYEPFSRTFQEALSNFSKNPRLASKIHPYNWGLSSSQQMSSFNYSAERKGKNSTIKEMSGSESIELRNAFEIFESLIGAAKENYFVKMDCEGAEFQIFESLRKNYIHDQIFGFIIEWHSKDPGPIVDTLISNNFKVQARGNSDIGLITAFR